MTVEDGFRLKQGEASEGREPLQGLQGLLESHGAGKSHEAGGMQEGPWAVRGHLLSLLGGKFCDKTSISAVCKRRVKTGRS